MDKETARAICDIHNRINNLLNCGEIQNNQAKLKTKDCEILDLTEQTINLEFQISNLEINAL